jgi:hypothetical protein
MLTQRDLLVVLTISIGCFLAVCLYIAPVFRESSEVRSKPADFAPIVAAVLSGRLRPDRCGGVGLPREYSSLTKYGQAYVERKKNGQVLIFFPTWDLGREGKRGYLFHNRPLSKADTLHAYQGYWEVGIADCFGLHYQRSHLPLVVERKVSRHWYYVRTPSAPHRE